MIPSFYSRDPGLEREHDWSGVTEVTGAEARTNWNPGLFLLNVNPRKSVRSRLLAVVDTLTFLPGAQSRESLSMTFSIALSSFCHPFPMPPGPMRHMYFIPRARILPAPAHRTHHCHASLLKVKVAQSCLTLCPWNSPDQNTGVGSPSLLQGIFPTQGLNPGLPSCRQILYQLSHREAQEDWSG